MKIPKKLHKLIMEEKNIVIHNISKSKAPPQPLAGGVMPRESALYCEGIRHGISIALQEIENYQPDKKVR